MPRYRVCFDGKWQGNFRDWEEAVEWARAVGETGRIVHVAKTQTFPRPMKLVAVFPETKAEEARWLWECRKSREGTTGLAS